jgi:DNA processing protein
LRSLPMESSEYHAWIALRLVPNLGRDKFRQLIEGFGSPEGALNASEGAMVARAGLEPSLARRIAETRADHAAIDKEIRLIEADKISLIHYQEEAYPQNLRNSADPPPLLYIRGALHPLDQFAISVVGTRRCSQYGRSTCEDITRQLAQRGFTIVSGMAAGIDGVAHHTALKSNGRTIGVLAGGLKGKSYPVENRRLAERVVEQGALITEYPMKIFGEKRNFPERNYLIAALSLGTVVIEASEKSGALITAHWAIEENRHLFAVPGDITRETFRGSNALIQSGAKLVQSADDILDELHYALQGLLQEKTTEIETKRAETLALSPEETRILELIKREPISVDDLLAAEYGGDRSRISDLSAALLNLEMKHLVRQLPGRIYAARH